jgi:hypothetical protein
VINNYFPKLNEATDFEGLQNLLKKGLQNLSNEKWWKTIFNKIDPNHIVNISFEFISYANIPNHQIFQSYHR